MVEETQEQMMERIKNMSPEELQEFQKSRCIFCHIIEGKVPSKKVYEDDKAIAILDINPATQGHILVMPKEHYAIMPQIPKDILDHLAVVTKKLSQIALQSLGAKGTNLLIQNGPAAGQKAQHFMLHVIPRYEGDNLPIGLGKESISEDDYNQVKDKIQSRINSLFGISPSQQTVANAIAEGEKLVAENPVEEQVVETKEVTAPDIEKQATEEVIPQQEVKEEKVLEVSETNQIGPQVVNPIREEHQQVKKSELEVNGEQQENIQTQEQQATVEQPQSQVPQNRLFDMSSVNSFIKSANQDINELNEDIEELQEVIEPEIVAQKEFDQDMQNDNVSEADIIEQANREIEETGKISSEDFEKTEDNNNQIINHTHTDEDNDSEEKENKEKKSSSEISLDDISRVLGM